MLSYLRQLLQPPEFRIPRPRPDAALDDWLERAVAALAPDVPPARGLTDAAHTAAEPEITAGVSGRPLGTLATRLLLLKRLLEREPDPSPTVQRAGRHVEAIWDALADAGVEIVDHTDQPYVPGLKLVVHSWQPTPGLARETIAETTKPSVYLHGRLIQMGEVHVAVPEGTAATTREEAP